MSRRPARGAILFALLLPWVLAAEPAAELRGRVTDASTREALPAAVVRILGTARGTIANGEGEFVLSLEPGSRGVVVSSIGYRPETLYVDLSSSLRREIALVSSPILLPEIVVTSEDPALEIIRRAIERKKRWFQRLHTYELDAFTRQTIRRDTGIAAIAESFTKGYWQRGDTLREVVQQKRQTSNVSAAENFASVGRILNFSEDRIRFVGYSFVGPIAEDALDYYDVRLKGTHRGGQEDVFDIALLPRTKTVPLFRGTIAIAGDSYALVGVEVEPNEAFVLPFVRERHLVYRQQFALYDKEFWLPADVRVDASFTIGLVGLTLPRVGLEMTSVMRDYRVNIPLPDTVFRKPRLSVDSSAARFDSTLWASTHVLPLSAEESGAYASLDSTQRLDVQFRPSGITATIGGGAGVAGMLIDNLDIAFNRVEGFHLGAQVTSLPLTPWLSGSVRWATGLSSRMSVYLLGAALSPFAGTPLRAGGDLYRRMDHRPDAGYYGTLVTSLGALLLKTDYRDYYRAEGWDAFLEFPLAAGTRGRIAYVAEEHRSVGVRTGTSLFFPSRAFRENPPVEEGILRALHAEVRIGREAPALDLVTPNALELSVEHSDPGFTGGDFLYTRCAATATLTIPTFGSEFLFRPSLRIRLFAGSASGRLPPQRWFDIESRLSGYAAFGALRTSGLKEFSGTSAISLAVEHNFRSIPFLALGLPFLYENGIELLLHGGAARTWTRDAAAARSSPSWQTEAGLSFSRILDLVRVDATWRLTGGGGFVVTAGIAPLL
jgi:hypothetical protein